MSSKFESLISIWSSLWNGAVLVDPLSGVRPWDAVCKWYKTYVMFDWWFDMWQYFAFPVNGVSGLWTWKVWSISVPAFCSTICSPCRPCKLNETKLEIYDKDHGCDWWHVKKVQYQAVMGVWRKHRSCVFFASDAKQDRLLLPSLDMWNKHSEKHSLSTLLMQL